MKLSKIASLVIAGGVTALMIGCGGGSSSGGTAGTTAADGYVLATGVSVNGENIMKAENNNTYLITLSKTAAELKDQVISITGFIDINANHKYDKKHRYCFGIFINNKRSYNIYKPGNDFGCRDG